MSRSTRMAGLVRNFGPLSMLLEGETGQRLQSELSWLQPRKGSPIRAVAHCFCGM